MWLWKVIGFWKLQDTLNWLHAVYGVITAGRASWIFCLSLMSAACITSHVTHCVSSSGTGYWAILSFSSFWERDEKCHVFVCFLNNHSLLSGKGRKSSPSTESPCYCLSTTHFKWIVHLKWNIMSSFTHQHVIQISLTLFLLWNMKREHQQNVEAAIFLSFFYF